MASSSSESSPRDQRVNEIIAAYLEAADAGQAPDRQEILARHPDLAAELAAFFADQDQFKRRAEPLGPASPGAPAHPEVTGAHTPEPNQGRTEGHGPREVAPGVIVAGRYGLVEKIGEGGMGEVWVARQTEPVKRKVALKLIRAGMDSKAVCTRFEQERQALAMMDHPNIARVLDGGLTEDRRPFFVMELVNGLPLTKFCDDARLTLRQRLELFVPICQAVQHAHHKGIVHRDLKPSNLLVTLYDGTPVPKVIDFGVAKAIGGKLTEETLSTQFGAVVGTLEYMAPEQAGFSSLDIDTRADLYSLGVILYELLTGLRPIDGNRLRRAALAEMMRIVQEEEPSKPSVRLSTDEMLASLAALRHTEPKRLMAMLRGELDWVVMKCLEKDRNRRYETANGLARDVQRYLADETVEARPPSARYRLNKFVRRNRGAVLTAALVLLVLVGGIVGTTWGLVRAEQAREAEAQQRQIAEAKEREALADKARAVAAAERERQAWGHEAEQRRLAEERKRQAEANEKKAVAEKQIAEAVRKFLERDLLLQADPTEQANAVRLLGGGFEAKENPTVRELLERAAVELTPAKIDAKFPGQKEVQASILHTVGTTYRAIGEYDKAVAFLARASDLYRDAYGAGHHDTLACRANLAVAYVDAWKLPQAIALLEELSVAFANQCGANHPDTLATRANLARAYHTTGKLTQAIDLYEQVHDTLIKTLGAGHPYTRTTQVGLAGAYRAAGKLPQAIQLLEQLRDAQLKKPGIDHPDTLATLANLAAAYRAARKLPQAIALCEQVRDLCVLKLGADHPNTLATMATLAGAYQDAGQLPRAIALFEQVRDALVKRLGPEHPLTLTTGNNLAQAYRAAGKRAQAIALLEQVRRPMVQKLPGHPSTVLILNNLAEAYRADGQLPQAIAVFEQARDLMVKTGHPDTLTLLNNLARAYQEAGKLPQAIALFEQVHDAMVQKLGPDDAGALVVLNNLALAYQEGGKREQALPRFRQAAAGIEKRQFQDEHAGPIVSNLIDCLEQVPQDCPEAESWRRKWLAVVKARAGADAPAYGADLTALGWNLLRQKKWTEAESILRESLTLRAKLEKKSGVGSRAPLSWQVANVNSLLGAALAGQQKYADAEPLLLAGYTGMKQREADIPSQGRFLLIEARERLVQLYEATGKKARADEWRKKR